METCMNIDYKNDKLKRQCTDLKEAKRCFPEKVAKKLHKLINYIHVAENLASVLNNPVYHFHDLKGQGKGLYAMDIDGRRGSYRLIVKFDNVSKEQVFCDAVSIVAIEIEEVSKHYE